MGKCWAQFQSGCKSQVLIGSLWEKWAWSEDGDSGTVEGSEVSESPSTTQISRCERMEYLDYTFKGKNKTTSFISLKK